MSRFSEYFKKKIVRPDKGGGCPPGTILTDEGCLPTGRRKTPRGFNDPDFPIYCGLEKEIPCLPDIDFEEPEPAPLPLPPPPPGKGTPQGNTAYTLDCPAADGVTTEGTITVPANFFVEVPEYSNDPTENASNEAAAKASADAAAQDFAKSTLRCIHSSEAVTAQCPAVGAEELPLEGSAKSLPAGYLRQQVIYNDLLDDEAPEDPAAPDTGVIETLTDSAQALVDSRLQCYRISEAATLTCAEEFDGLIFTDTEGATIARMEDHSVDIPEGAVRELVDLDEESDTYLEPTQAQVNSTREDTYPGKLQCRLLSSAVSESCPAAVNPAGGAAIPALTPSNYVVPEGRATSIIPNDTPTGGASLRSVAQDSAEALHISASGMLEREFTCFYGNPELAQGCADPTADADTGEIEAYLSLANSSLASLDANIVIKAATISAETDSKFSQIAADEAAAAAYSAAQGNLEPICVYGNLAKTDPCPDPDNQHPDSVNGVVVEGEILQVGGWDSIPTQVESLLQARKRCLYGNDARSGNCNVGDFIIDPYDPYFAGHIAVVSENTVFSTQNKATANSIAASQAAASTICLYSNFNEVTASCPAPAEHLQEGTDKTIEQYTVISAVSPLVANTIAEERGRSLLTCQVKNDETEEPVFCARGCSSGHPDDGVAGGPKPSEPFSVEEGEFTRVVPAEVVSTTNNVDTTIQTTGAEVVKDELNNLRDTKEDIVLLSCLYSNCNTVTATCPAPAEYVEGGRSKSVSAFSVFSGVSSSSANAVAEDMGLSLIMCEVKNDRTPDPGIFCDQGCGNGDDGVAAGPKPSDPFFVEEGEFTRVVEAQVTVTLNLTATIIQTAGGASVKEELNDLRGYREELTKLTCLYSNCSEYTASCPAPHIRVEENDQVINKFTVFSPVDSPAADTFAEEFIQNSITCLVESEEREDFTCPETECGDDGIAGGPTAADPFKMPKGLFTEVASGEVRQDGNVLSVGDYSAALNNVNARVAERELLEEQTCVYYNCEEIEVECPPTTVNGYFVSQKGIVKQQEVTHPVSTAEAAIYGEIIAQTKALCVPADLVGHQAGVFITAASNASSCAAGVLSARIEEPCVDEGEPMPSLDVSIGIDDFGKAIGIDAIVENENGLWSTLQMDSPSYTVSDVGRDELPYTLYAIVTYKERGSYLIADSWFLGTEYPDNLEDNERVLEFGSVSVSLTKHENKSTDLDPEDYDPDDKPNQDCYRVTVDHKCPLYIPRIKRKPPRAFEIIHDRGGDPSLFVSKGMVRNVVPTLSGTALSNDYRENVLPIPATGTRDYYLKISLDAEGEVSAVEIEYDPPSTSPSTTLAWAMLGSVTVADGSVSSFSNTIGGSLDMVSCGVIHYFSFL